MVILNQLSNSRSFHSMVDNHSRNEYDPDTLGRRFETIFRNSVNLNNNEDQTDYLESGSLDVKSTRMNYESKALHKPNMMQLMLAISGLTAHELYTNPKWDEIRSTASELLYGVMGSHPDTRDWSKIMASEDIVSEARSQTFDVIQPRIEFADERVILKNGYNDLLRVYTGEIPLINSSLKNFGAKIVDMAIVPLKT